MPPDTTAPSTTVLVERSPEGYAILTLNRPQAMNALSRELRTSLAAAVAALEADPQIRVLILTGAGRAFCAGLDLKELGATGLAADRADPAGINEAVRTEDPVRALGRFSGPIIGAINGAAITGGFELALACDVLLASSAARFADTHARVGVMPGWGLSQKLSRVIGVYRAKELSLSGNFLSAQQACDWGLVNRVVAPELLLEQAVALARDMLSAIPSMLVSYKRVIDEGFALSFGQAMTLEQERASAANASVRAEEIEARREQVRSRAHALSAAAAPTSAAPAVLAATTPTAPIPAQNATQHATPVAAPALAASDIFSSNYRQARTRWIQVLERAGGRVHSHHHPSVDGPGGGPLYMDIGIIGSPVARSMLVLSIGTHGIEGFAGSAVLTGWLRARQGTLKLGDDCALMMIHAVNPWGFAHEQRGTEENVDLNRNFIDFNAPLPTNAGYAELHAMLKPARWVESEIAACFTAMDAFRARVGEKRFSDAFNGGQYSHPEGMFFGGRRPQWSNNTVTEALRKHVGSARQAIFVDLHTGIGPFGKPFFINFDAPGTPARERAVQCWGEEALNMAGSTHKAFATYSGLLLDAFARLLPAVECTSVVVEFGTRPRPVMQRAQMALMWLRTHPDADQASIERIRSEYREAFYPSEPQWRESVLAEGIALIDRGVAALAERSK